MRHLRWTLALLVAATIAGCGGGDDEDAQSPADGGPTTSEETTTAPAEAPLPPTGEGRGGVALEEVGSFDQPVYVAQPEAEREHLYVVERCGRVVRVPADGGEAKAFLDISDQVTCEGSEQGLLSVAFAPDYERSGHFYVYFTDTAGDVRVVEYTRGANGADPEPGRELLRVESFAPNHNGGQLQFGADGLLYIGTGDGGGAGDPQRTAQDPSRLLGKLLRIDPRPGSEPEIVAMGLRNPWRFSFDRATGDVWIGDVGQDSLEEVDAAGADDVARRDPRLNFGWSAFEGSERFNADQEAPGAIPPVLEYPLSGSNCAVTGGYVVRDPELTSLFGRYVYGDFCAGDLRSFAARPAVRTGDATDDRELGVHVPSLSSFGEDASGRVYATSLEGPVYRLAAE